MRVFLINLNKDNERLAAADAQLRRLGVAYERIPAVYARGFSEVVKHKVVNRFRWWCAVGRKATDGEIGCGMSHATIYRKMVDEDIPFACVMEDDVVLDERFPAALRAVAQNGDFSRSVVYLLSNHSDGAGQLGDRHSGFRSPSGTAEFSNIKCDGDFCAECYVISCAAARKLMAVNSPLITPCDWWGRWRRNRVIELYHLFPTVASQAKNDFVSGTHPGMMSPVCDLPIPALVWHKFKRLIGISIDRLCVFLWNR